MMIKSLHKAMNAAFVAALLFPALSDAREFNFDMFFSDACDVSNPAGVKSFNDAYLTVNRGTSLVNKPHWLYPDDVYYGDNRADCNLVALCFGFAPEDCKEEVLKNLVTDIIRLNGGHYKGDPRTYELLLPGLSRFGRSDVAYLLSMRDSAMLASYIPVWEREVIAGIKPAVHGSDVLTLAPDFSVEDMTSAEGCAEFSSGRVESRWTKNLMRAEWDVSVPEGMNAEIHIPALRKRDFRHRKGVRFVRFEDGGSVWKIKGGDYHFSLKLNMPDPHIIEESFLFDICDYPLCHSASITEAADGDLIAVYTAGDNEAAPNTRVMMTRKNKGGAWSKPVEMTASSLADTCAYQTYNPVIWQVPEKDGEMLLFYHTGGARGKKAFLMRSSDCGHTWSEPELLPDGVAGPERAHPIYLDGKIIASGEADAGWLRRPGYFISDDLAHTWRTSSPSTSDYAVAHDNRKPGRAGENWDVARDGFPRENTFEILWSIQPSILVHRNGLLQSIGRTVHSRMSCCWSYDGGESWGNEYLCDLPSNNSGFSAITLRDGRFVRVFNDFESLPGTPRWEQNNARTPLTLAISEDGILWTKIFDIETGPIHNNKFPSGYCYPDVIEGSDGCLHLVYTWQRRRIKYVKIKLD